MRHYLLVLFIFFAGAAYAQQTPIDSLQAALKIATTDSARVMLHCQLNEQYFLSDPPKGIVHGLKAEKLAAKINFKKGQAKALNALGVSYLIMAEYGKALEKHLQALKLRESMHDTAGMVASYINLGNVYFKTHDQGRAIQNYLAGSALAEKIGDKLGLSRIYNNVGSFHENKGDYEEALKYFLKASKLKEELGDTRGWAVTLEHIGVVHMLQGNAEKALPYLFQALRLNEEAHNSVSNIGTSRMVAEAYLSLKNYDEAMRYARQSYEAAQSINSHNEITVSAGLVETIAEAQGDFKTAHTYLQIVEAHSDSMYNEQADRIREEITAKFETEKKELENQRLRTLSENQSALLEQKNLVQGLGIIAIFLLGVLVVVLYLGRKRMKSQNLQLEKLYIQVQNQNAEIGLQKDAIAGQATELQIHNTKMEEANAFKSKVLSIISHDMRSPLVSIKMMFNLHQRKQPGEVDMMHMLRLLEKEVDVAMNMLNNLLIWAKAQMDGSEIHTEAVTLHELAHENLSLLASQAQGKNITLINKVPAFTLVQADKERLNFVLRNLLSNALKFTYPGGQVQVLATQEQDEVVLAIQDSGKGIPDRYMSLLFTNRRFSTVGTCNEKGTGLGLLLCQEFVESIHGRIWVKSKEGDGTTFFVALPSAEVGQVIETV